MTADKLIQLLIPVIGIVAAVLSAGLSYYFSKRLQINANERRLKEEYYQSYINALSQVAVGNNQSKAKDEFANAHNTIPLIGSSLVVSLAMDFHDYVKESNQNFSVEVQNEKFTELVKAMREDLYADKRINSAYPKIHLSGESGKRK